MNIPGNSHDKLRKSGWCKVKSELNIDFQFLFVRQSDAGGMRRSGGANFLNMPNFVCR
jgi:hypothetical protein